MGFGHGMIVRPHGAGVGDPGYRDGVLIWRIASRNSAARS